MHQNAQRLLRPLAVVNPHADQLTFLSDKTRTRRDHEKYLTLIDTIALLHQHQRPVKTMPNLGQGDAVEYIEASAADIAQANAIAHEVLGRSLDELPPQTRRLLAAIVAHVQAQVSEHGVRVCDVRFTRRDVRAFTGWGDTQLRVHLARLLDLEYLLAHRGMRGQSYEYELAFDGDAGVDAPHLTGLIDATSLASTSASSRGASPEFAASTRGHGGVIAGGLREVPTAAKQATARVAADHADESDETHAPALNGHHRPYPHPVLAASEVQR